METAVHGIQPQALTDGELAKYAALYTFAQLPDSFKAEIIARYAQLIEGSSRYVRTQRTETHQYTLSN